MKKITLVVIVLIILFMFMGCTSSVEKKLNKEEFIPVKTVPIKKEKLAIPIYASGRLSHKTTVKLSFKVGGILDQLQVDEGDVVKKGQLLASLDLSEIKSRYNQAKKSWEKAKRDLERIKNLYNDRAATLEQFQDVKTGLELAESNLNIAKFNLNHSVIKAPADGNILKRFAEEGEMMGVGIPVFYFGSTDDHWVVKVGISDCDIVRVALEDKAVIQLDAYPNKKIQARVSEISHSLDPASGTFEVEMRLDEDSLKDDGDKIILVNGFIAKVQIIPYEAEVFSVIPIDSLVEGEGSYGVVFTVLNKRAIRKKIEVVHIFSDTMVVRSGLESIKEVITSGAAYLRDGSSVQLVNQ